MYFPLRTAFASSQSAWIVVFSFSFVSIYYSVPSLIAWLTHWFFSRVFLNLHAFGGFPDFFLWLMSSFIALWSESVLGMVSILLYLTKGCFVTPYVLYLGECSMCTREDRIVCWFGMQSSNHICQVHLIQCIIQDPSFFIDPVSRWSIHCCQWSVKVPCHYRILINKVACVCDSLF